MEVREIRHSQLRKSKPSLCTPAAVPPASTQHCCMGSESITPILTDQALWFSMNTRKLASSFLSTRREFSGPLSACLCLPSLLRQTSFYCCKALQCVFSPMIVSLPCPTTLRIPSLFKITHTHLCVLPDYVLTQDLCLLRNYISLMVGGKDLKSSQEQINGRWH